MYRNLLLFFALLFLFPLQNFGQFFKPKENFITSNSSFGTSRNVAIIDIDNDFDKDIVLIMDTGQQLIMLNDGQGNFQASNTFNTNPYSTDLAVADFDGDEDMDFFFVDANSSQHDFYLNQGSGQYMNKSMQVNLSGSSAVATFDINNDNRPDIVLGRNGQNMILINKGDGSFRDETSYRLPILESETNDLTLFDFDQDGDVDIFFSNNFRNRLLVNNGVGGFVDETMQRLPSVPYLNTQGASVADVDNDGDLDLVLATADLNGSQNAQNQLFLNVNGEYFFDATTSRMPLIKNQSFDVDFIDIDQDGDLDMAFANHGEEPVSILANDGDGFYEDVSYSYLGHQDAAWACKLIVEDLNGDRLDDLYICLKGETDRIFLRDKDGTAATVTSTKEAIALAKSIQVFPNPVVDHFSVTLPDNVGEVVSFRILDLTGRVITELTHNNTSTNTFYFQLSQVIPTGIYLLEINLAKLSTGQAGVSYAKKLKIE